MFGLPWVPPPPSVCLFLSIFFQISTFFFVFFFFLILLFCSSSHVAWCAGLLIVRPPHSTRSAFKISPVFSNVFVSLFRSLWPQRASLSEEASISTGTGHAGCTLNGWKYHNRSVNVENTLDKLHQLYISGILEAGTSCLGGRDGGVPPRRGWGEG